MLIVSISEADENNLYIQVTSIFSLLFITMIPVFYSRASGKSGNQRRVFL